MGTRSFFFSTNKSIDILKSIVFLIGLSASLAINHASRLFSAVDKIYLNPDDVIIDNVIISTRAILVKKNSHFDAVNWMPTSSLK